MSKYEYTKFGYRSYEEYAEISENPPSKEEYEARMDKMCKHNIEIAKANLMIQTLREIKAVDIDLLMQVYDAVASVLNLPTDEEVEEDYKKGLEYRNKEEKIHSKAVKKLLEEGTPSSYSEFQQKLKTIKAELKGE